MPSCFSLLRCFTLVALALGLIGTVPVSAQGDSTPTASETLAYPVTAYLCDTDPGTFNPNGGSALGGGCEPAAGIAFSVVLEADESAVGTCTTADDGTCTVDAPNESRVKVTEDEATVPLGYAVRDNPQTDTNATEFRGRIFFNVATGDDAGAAEPPEFATDETSSDQNDQTDGSTAAIYAGNCGGDFTDEPVATLTNVREPARDIEGADGASAVETSFTTLDLPLNDILAEDHVLIVFDEDDDTVALACGAIGGIVTGDGTLVFGLPALDDSRFSGVAYLAENGDQTNAMIFLAEDLNAAPDATPVT